MVCYYWSSATFSVFTQPIVIEYFWFFQCLSVCDCLWLSITVCDCLYLSVTSVTVCLSVSGVLVSAHNDILTSMFLGAPYFSVHTSPIRFLHQTQGQLLRAMQAPSSIALLPHTALDGCKLCAMQPKLYPNLTELYHTGLHCSQNCIWYSARRRCRIIRGTRADASLQRPFNEMLNSQINISKIFTR